MGYCYLCRASRTDYIRKHRLCRKHYNQRRAQGKLNIRPYKARKPKKSETGEKEGMTQ